MAIDRVKGIQAKPMPNYWFNKDVLNIKDGDTAEQIAFKQFNQSIVANKKPYFMTYIYPDLQHSYKQYIARVNKKCSRDFDTSLEQLMLKVNRTATEDEFIEYYYLHLPVSNDNCVMNKLCHLIEAELDGIKFYKEFKPFDYNILKSDYSYRLEDYRQIYNLYVYYKNILEEYTQKIKSQKIDAKDMGMYKSMLLKEFKKQAYNLCSNKYQLCNIVLDICYSQNSSKQFAWDICGDVIIENLLKKNRNKIKYLVKQADGEIEFCGEYFTVKEKELLVNQIETVANE